MTRQMTSSKNTGADSKTHSETPTEPLHVPVVSAATVVPVRGGRGLAGGPDAGARRRHAEDGQGRRPAGRQGTAGDRQGAARLRRDHLRPAAAGEVPDLPGR